MSVLAGEYGDYGAMSQPTDTGYQVYQEGANGQAPDTVQQVQALGQESDGFLDDAEQTDNLNLNYVGGNTSVGVGFDTEFKGRVDGSHVFMESEDSMTSGQGWLGIDPGGDETLTGAGAKINHHWVTRDEGGQALHVNKVFGAYDQNAAEDKKVTGGYGQERENFFWSGHVSKGLSDLRESGKTGDGSIIYEKAYDYGVGGRVGTFLGDHLLRVQGGLDYEWGTDQADSEDTPSQLTVTGGVEKFFFDSPHSIGANVEISKESGGYAGDDHEVDVSGNVSYRYEFGGDNGIYAPNQQYRRVRVEIPGKTEVVTTKVPRAPKVDRKLVKHTMELESDTFFKVGDHHLTPEAQNRLRAVLARIRQTGFEGNIRITGNTCDIGSDADNQLLSERRAATVRSFMIANGFDPSCLIAQGYGESRPKYPNVDATRHKNRRVDIEYVTYETQYKDEVVQQGYDEKKEVRVVSEPRVVWRRELIPTPPTWVNQALHNNIQYKQRIGTYRTLGPDGGSVVDGTNQAPLAADDAFSTKVNTALTIDVLTNDSDPDGDVLTITAFDQGTAQGGSVVLADGFLVYTPAADFSGVDSFTYTVSDGKGGTATATVVITVDGGSAGELIANDDAVKLTQALLDEGGGSVLIDVLADDVYTGTVSVMLMSAPGKGTVTVGADNRVVYTPIADETGTDTFTYLIKDASGNQSNQATVTITLPGVDGTNQEPQAVNDNVLTKVNTALTIDVLGNDSDPDGDALTVTAFDQTTAQGGSVVLADGFLVYTPKVDFIGVDSFEYTISDGQGGSATATVTITIEDGVNHAPVAVDDKTSTLADTDVTIDVLGNDTDPDGDKLFIEGFASHTAQGGTVVQQGDKLVYTPPAGFTGVDSFEYGIHDGELSSVENGTVTITVTGGVVADLVLRDDGTGGAVSGDTYSFVLNDSLPRTLPVLSNDSLDGNYRLRIVSWPTFGSVSVSADGQSFVYSLRHGYCEGDSFVYTVEDASGNPVKDASGNLVTATVYINIL
ncbi:MAG TPA: Ig-like domain-containing protein [Thiolinea sp.]|nr:Ig-like domain-containing protein [Thiolinea sp.]